MKKEKIIILGMGVSGQAVASYLAQEGLADVVCIDKNPKEGVLSDYDVAKNKCDLMVVSPGVSPNNPIYQQAKEQKIEIIGEIEFALRRLNNTMLAVTGTNGKTTTALLTYHVLKKLKKKALVLGNSHTPLTSHLKSLKDEIIVLELSSYQLETLKSKKIDVAVILNITEDHLERHGTMESYAKSKMSISNCIKGSGKLFIDRETYEKYSRFLNNDAPINFLKENVELLLPDCYRNKSKHDVKNMAAAFAMCNHVGITFEEFFKAALDFEKPEHRLEFVRDINGVTYYNDSKATNPDAVIKAAQALEKDVFLLVGGIDKKTSYTSWNEPLKGKVKGFFAFGETKYKIGKDLDSHFSYILCDNLKDAIYKATIVAKPGDKIVLSPGCASFDEFENYEQRGKIFKNLVQDINLEKIIK